MLKIDQFLTTFEANRSHAYLLVGSNRPEADRVAFSVARRLGINSFDTHLVTEEGIVAVRALQRRLALKPHSSSHHLVFLPQAAILTPEAQNALLKILEEPLAPTIFLLVTPDESWLLPTVVSRCQKISLTAADPPTRAIPTALLSIGEQSLSDQFVLAETLARDEGLSDLLDAWVVALRKKLQTGSREARETVKTILAAKEKVSQTQANRRLVLEDLFLSLTYPKR